MKKMCNNCAWSTAHDETCEFWGFTSCRAIREKDGWPMAVKLRRSRYRCHYWMPYKNADRRSLKDRIIREVKNWMLKLTRS